MVECIFKGFLIWWKNIFMLEKFKKYALYFLLQEWFVVKFHNIEISTTRWDLPSRLNFFPGVLRSIMILLAIVKYKLSWLSVLSMGFLLWKVKCINARKVYNVYIFLLQERLEFKLPWSLVLCKIYQIIDIIVWS